MAQLNIVSLPLYPDADYSYSVALEGQSYQLRFTYNETMALYTMSLYDADLTLLVAGVGLVPGYPIMGDYAIPNLSGYFLLTTKSSQDKEYYKTYPDKIHEYYNLVYLYVDTTE